MFPKVEEMREKPLTLTINEERKRRAEYAVLPNNNQRKGYARANGVKGCYSFMKLPYHKYHHDYQPDPMHTVADVVEHVIHFLIGKVNMDKQKAAEEEMGEVKKRKVNSKIARLSKNEISLGNKRCRSLKFPKDCSGFVGDVFTSPKVTLRNTHGWTEVLFFYV